MKKTTFIVTLAAAVFVISVVLASADVPANSVGTNQIINNSIRSEDIRNSTIKSADIKNGTIKSVDIKSKEVKSSDIDDNAVRERHIKDGAVNEDKLASGIMPEVTVIKATGSNVDSTVTYTYELMRSLGSFTKFDSSSNLKLAWTSHGSVTGRFCDFQVRIDGIRDDGSSSTTFGGSGRAVIGEVGNNATSDLGDSFAVVTVFQNISAGVHDVEIWLRGDADSCTLNTGNFVHNIIIEEFISPNGIEALTAGDGSTEPAETSASEYEPVIGGMSQ